MTTDAIQETATSPSTVGATHGMMVSLETIVYVVLLCLALVLRLAELDTAPLNDVEAREALAVWHFVWPDAPGDVPQATSPLLFLLNVPVLAFFGGAGAAPRVMTALGGVALVMLPVLWRRHMGRVAALATTILLMLSTTTFTSARTMSPVVWTVVLGVVGLWTIWQFVETRRSFYAISATVMAASVLLLAEGSGFVFLAILAVAWVVALFLSNQDAPETHPMTLLRAAMADWPWRDALLTSGLFVVLVATVFFMAPGGLTHIGELLARGIEILFQRPVDYPASFPLLITLLYEPALWIFGAIGVYLALNDDRFWGRFLVGWLFAALVAAILVQGAGPEHALWLVMPLAALAGDVTARMLRLVEDAYWQPPVWATLALAFGAVALLFIAATNLLRVAGSLMRLGEGVMLQQDQILPLLIAATTLVLLVILFFLGGSLWGARTAWHGIGLGVLIFLGVYGTGSAWRVAVARYDDPRELWHVNPVAREVSLLRETLVEASLRDTGMPNRMAGVAQVPADGAVAWQLRDFANFEYISALDRGLDAPVIIAPPSQELPSPNARYVGQNFILNRHWDMSNLRWADLLFWLFHREADRYPQLDASGFPDIGEMVVLWERGDVYGLPPEEDIPEGEEEVPLSEEVAP